MTDLLPPSADGLARAADLLGNGRLVAFPTDTVYGVALAERHRSRLPDLFALKDRPAEKRIPILLADLETAVSLGWRPDERARDLAARFWPGPLTLVLPVSAGKAETQAFRAPDHPVALELIRRAGPLLATSANRSGEPDALEASEVLTAFAARADELAAVIDGGRVPGGVASTVVDLSVSPARVLRQGPIDRGQLAEVVELAP